LVQVTIEQLGDFASGAWFPNLVQRSQNMLAETTTGIRNLLHWKGEFSRQPLLRGFEEDARKGKGCDIGYALAASSCEGTFSVDACTVTALDAITAFAVPNPNYSSRSRRFFQVRMPVESPLRANHSAYFGLAKFYFSHPFQPSTSVTLNACFRAVNAAFQCKA
jgi:hypothetical protein